MVAIRVWFLDKSPAKSYFFIRLQIFLHVGCNFLPPEELPPHAKNDECGYQCLKIWSRNLHNWHFLEMFVQIPKHNSSQSCIKCIFAAQKKYLQPAQIKVHPDENFLQHAKISPPHFALQIKSTQVWLSLSLQKLFQSIYDEREGKADLLCYICRKVCLITISINDN